MLLGCCILFYYLCIAQENACLIANVFTVIYFLLYLMPDKNKIHVIWEYLKN